MHRTFVMIAGLLGFLGVALGAFAAHGLRSRLSPEMLQVFETGVRYHMYHALALLMVGVSSSIGGGRLLRVSGWLFVAGIVLFSGSLYVLALTGVGLAGAVTPIGGLLFLAGWICVAAGAYQAKKE